MLWLMACVDLPEGWEDAERIADFSQAECRDTGETALDAEADGDGVALDVSHVGARCSQDLEAWWQPTGDGTAGVLVQPVDTTPSMVAKCDCSYDLSMTVPTPAPVTLDVWQRGDRWADDDPQPFELGTVVAE